MRYDFFVHVMIHTRKEHISMCTRRNVAVLIEQIYLICQVYSSLNSNCIQSNIAGTFSIISICKLNVLNMSERYLYYVVLHLYKSVYKLMLFYYFYYWNSYSLIILLHVHIHKITYYMSWLTYTLRRPYLQFKYNTNTDIYIVVLRNCVHL